MCLTYSYKMEQHKDSILDPQKAVSNLLNEAHLRSILYPLYFAQGGRAHKDLPSTLEKFHPRSKISNP